VGQATHTWECAAALWNQAGPFDRLVILTDEQAAYIRSNDYRTYAPPATSLDVPIPAHVPIYSWDLRGYATVSMELGRGRYQLGGLTDAAFRLIPLLERSGGGWPWEVTA